MIFGLYSISVRRNLPHLTPAQCAALAAEQREQDARERIAVLVKRLGLRMPGVVV